MDRNVQAVEDTDREALRLLEMLNKVSVSQGATKTDTHLMYPSGSFEMGADAIR